VYSFCSRNISGAVVVVAINIQEQAQDFSVYEFSSSPRAEYVLTAPEGDMSSVNIELNGVVLNANPDGSLPSLSPNIVESNTPMTLPPLSYGFFVFPEAQAPACF
jgi:heparanase 1